MALTSDTNQELTMYDICDEFNEPRDTPLSAFYRGAGIVPDNSTNSGVPASGEIGILDFYGASNTVIVTVTEGGQNFYTGTGSNYDYYYGFALASKIADYSNHPEFGSRDPTSIPGPSYSLTINAIYYWAPNYTGARKFVIGLSGYNSKSTFESATPQGESTLLTSNANWHYDDPEDTSYWSWDAVISYWNGSGSRTVEIA